MAGRYFNWSFILLAGVFLISWVHPFHMSVTEINHNAQDKTLEISCKLFTDDFEKVLARNYNTKVDLTNPPVKAAMDSLVKKYVFSHLGLKLNGKPVSFEYVGFETDKEASYAYVEVDNVNGVTKVDIYNSLMYDMFEDQVNIMHVITGGKRESTKLTYPDKQASVEF